MKKMLINSHCSNSDPDNYRDYWAKGKTVKLIMRLTILKLFLIIGMLNSMAAVNSQTLIKSLKLENVELSSALEKIEQITSYDFVFSYDDVAGYKVNVDLENATLEQCINEVLENKPFHFSTSDDLVIIAYEKIVDEQIAEELELGIKGNVTDEDGTPLPGATIMEKGTLNGTTTDVEGKYSLTVSGKNSVIQVSYIGFETQEIKVDAKTLINVVLNPSASSLDEVVVTGYQTISKERATGSYAQVKQEDMESFYDSDVLSLLEGKVAGLSTYDNKIVIRGISTFNSSSKPLIVIDGLPVDGKWNDGSLNNSVWVEGDYSALNDINPNDIKSVTVLKDAAAASIYGARAANGVIVITTKSAQKGKTEVDFSVNYVMTPKDNKNYLKLASIGDYIDFEKKYLENNPAYIADPIAYFDDKDSNNEKYSPVSYYYNEWARGKMTETEAMAAIEALKNNDEYRNQYVKNALQNQFQQQYNLSFRTATEKSNLVLSINALTNKAEQINNKSEKYTLYFRNTMKLYDWLNISYGINMVMSKSKRPDVEFGRGWSDAYPYEQLLDANGNRVYRDLINQVWADKLRTPENVAYGLYDMKYNALDELEKNQETKDYSNTRMFLNANFKITDYLSYDVLFQYEIVNTNQQTYYSEDTYVMRRNFNRYAEFVPAASSWSSDAYKFHLPKGGRLKINDQRQNNYTFRNQLNFNKLINNDHAITALVGFEMRENKHKGLWKDLYGFDDQSLAIKSNINWSLYRFQGALYPTPIPFVKPLQTYSEKMNRYVSIYANGSYTYKGKYSATASFRIDQTNLFGTDPKYRYRPLWSVGASWLISKESFMSNLDWINMLKVRTSYGIGGNVDQSTSLFMVANLGNSYYTGNPTTTINTPPNPLLRWEKTTSYNFGVDFSMFKGRLSGSIDIYHKYSDDLLAKKQFDATLGFTTGIVNNGAMSNQGFELRLSYNWVNNEDWSVSTTLTAAYNKNNVERINSYPNVATDLLYNDLFGYYLEGVPMSSIYAHKYAGLDKSIGDPSVHTLVKDENGDDQDVIISTNFQNRWEALVNMGQTNPKWSGSFQPIVKYKDFQLSTLITFYTGNVKRDVVTPLYKELKGGNIHGDMINAWTPNNKDTDIPRMGSYIATDNYRYGNWHYADIHIIDASKVNLRNIALSYTMPLRWVRVIKAQMVRFNFQVNDPWYWSASLQSNYKYKPILPSYVFGVTIKF
jgi:TonB-linked SusC/RagA family outer membrane protein